MTQNPESRIHGHQPPLPLVVPDRAAETTGDGTEVEWRLDEHTRMVGRMGIAAARARLHSSSGPRGTDGADRAPGRAA